MPTFEEVSFHVQWQGTDPATYTVTDGADADSDATVVGSGDEDLSVDAVEREIQFEVQNQGSHSSGDTVDIGIRYSLGDPRDDGNDAYADDDHTVWLTQVDVSSADVETEAFALKTAVKGFKVRVINNSPNSNDIEIGAVIREKRVL